MIEKTKSALLAAGRFENTEALEQEASPSNLNVQQRRCTVKGDGQPPTKNNKLLITCSSQITFRKWLYFDRL